MNFPRDHIERIKELGYSEPEARFLYIVAVHSGYFTVGQFLSFANSSYGKRATSFTQKLLKQGHATVRDYMRRGSIFHLFSRTVYGKIDKDNLSNSKKHSFDYMRTRLVLLDFILANQELTYFETEEDKIRFFCEELGISKDCLPVKVYEGNPRFKPALHYFVDKFPLFLAPPFPGAPPVVTLTYVDSGLETRTNFLAHLAAYQQLFGQLKSFRFLYIAARDAYFRNAEERFRTLVERPFESDVSSELLRYFQVRVRWERHEYVVPVTEDLEFLNDARRRFHGDRFESLFEAWSTGKITERELRLEFPQLKSGRPVFFESFLVQQRGSPVSEFIRRGDGCAKDTRHPSRRPAHRDCARRNIFVTRSDPKSKKGETMSIINKPPELVKREYQLQEPIALAVEKYATFIQSTPDHVVNSALKMVISKDVEFRRWYKQQQTQPDSKDGHGTAEAAQA